MLLFPDTFTNYNHPELGQAATVVLERLGYQVVVPRTGCCGRPMLSKGMMDKARRNARSNVDRVLPYVEKGAKLVGLEPSCILSFRDDYVDLLDDSAARTVAGSAMLFEEFMLYAREKDGATLDFAKKPGKLLFHGHCHQEGAGRNGAGYGRATVHTGVRRAGNPFRMLRHGWSIRLRKGALPDIYGHR